MILWKKIVFWIQSTTVQVVIWPSTVTCIINNNQWNQFHTSRLSRFILMNLSQIFDRFCLIVFLALYYMYFIILQNALHTGQVLLQPRMAQLETLEAKVIHIIVFVDFTGYFCNSPRFDSILHIIDSVVSADGQNRKFAVDNTAKKENFLEQQFNYVSLNEQYEPQFEWTHWKYSFSVTRF